MSNTFRITNHLGCYRKILIPLITIMKLESEIKTRSHEGLFTDADYGTKWI